MSHQIDPPSYPEGAPLPRCSACRERSLGWDGCLNPDCLSHALCEWCGDAEGVAYLPGSGDLVCGTCGIAALRAERGTSTIEVERRGGAEPE